MSSEEEFNARSLLQEMQARLAESPHVALGLPNHATPSDIRSAFLHLTKTFHPARFGRMTPEIQRLSNEVFLSLRAAHDLLSKPRPTRAGSTTASPPLRPGTKPFGVPISPATRPPTAPKSPANPDRVTGPQPPVRPSTSGINPTSNRTGSIPVARTPPTSQPPQPKPPQQPPARPPPTVTVSTAPRGSNPVPVRAVASSSTLQALDPAVAPFLEMLGRGQWDQAFATIDALATGNPQNKRFAALAAYARGRRAQVEGNMRDAQIELNQALMIDPELELARIAVADMYKARK